MKVRFLSIANIEFDDAVKYYNHQMPGLGYRFLQEVDGAIKRIKLMPEAWARIGQETRRCILKGFPYALLYVIEKDNILISAVAHLHRDPEHYRDRII